MKKLLLLLFAFANVNSIAQIPNNGFEDWITEGNCMKPQGWYGTNDFSDTSGSNFGVTRSADHYPATVGNYSIRIQNDVSLLPDWSAMGIIWTGDLSGNDNPAFPVSGHPTSFCGYYKFLPQNNDTMRIFLSLYHDGIEVSQTMLETTVSAMEWTSFCLSIPNYEAADSGRIMMASFYPDGNLIPRGNSILYVDNLSFDGLITAVHAPANAAVKISVYPNPATEALTIVLPAIREGQIDLKIYNTSGSQVYVSEISTAASTAVINVSEFAEGVYYIRMMAHDETIFEQHFIRIK
ncbi:MAG: T9SS type A sorting domain-containing protein [Chitinophagales bacterium]